MDEAAVALRKHINQADRVRTKSTRTTDSSIYLYLTLEVFHRLSKFLNLYIGYASINLSHSLDEKPLLGALSDLGTH